LSVPRSDTLRLAVLQTDAALEDIAANAARIAVAASGVGADLILTPELSLTGYSLADSAAALACELHAGEAIAGAEALSSVPGPVVVGLPERSPLGHPYNAAAVLSSGAVRFVHRKRYLPTYGMFDEARYFAPGETVDVYRTDGGWRVGVLICEDLWHPALAYLLALAGADVIAVLAAAPGRGVWQGGAAGPFTSWDGWIRLARATAQVHGVYLVLANRAGVEGPVTFAGGSLIVAPDGGLLAQAGTEPDAVLEAAAERTELDLARGGAPHRRDEDARWLRARLAELADG